MPLQPGSPASADVAPSVSIILPTLNERGFIFDCLASLLQQDYPALTEILVVDGGSTDGTRDIVASLPPPVRLVDNPRVTAAAAMNIGLAASVGEIICRADAHALYRDDYIRHCVEVLQETGAANVGGRMRAQGTTRFGRAVAAVTSTPAGVGPARFHYALERQDVDTVYLGCWRRQYLEELGGWDEESLQWAAEDQELNFRIRQRGGRIVLDPDIVSWYFPRETPRHLWRQYFNYGVAKASTLAKHGRLPYWRPLAPAALVGAAAVGGVAGRGPVRLAVPLVHGLMIFLVAGRLSRAPGVRLWDAAAAAAICHWSYGFGFWRGLLRILRRQPFDSRPRGHR